MLSARLLLRAGAALRAPVAAVAVSVLRAKHEMHDPLDHVTGLEKRELLAYLAGDCDPFHILAIKRGVGTRENPTLVPSSQSKRLVGCVCAPGASSINFIWLHDGTPKRCECGYWFELCPVAPL